MKTKKSSFGKSLISKRRFVVIAIVLCSMLLVALPATTIAAEEDDFVLGIYGNANEDDTIDMRDLTYVKLIFFGERPETELADAKYDGEINPLDFVQIKLIIVGKEKELTVVQYIGKGKLLGITEKAVTVPMPIKRIVTLDSGYGPEILFALEEQDKLIGVDRYAKENFQKIGLKSFIKEISSVGSSGSPDYEKIIELKPDVVLGYAYTEFPEQEETLKAARIPFLQMDFFRLEKYPREVRNIGWLLNKKERAKELIKFEQQHLDLIKDGVDGLEAEQKPTVYIELGNLYTAGIGTPQHKYVVASGGTNVFADINYYKAVDSEEILVRNPEIIIVRIWAGIVPYGYDVTDTAPIEKFREDIMNRPGWENLDAVKNGRVYIFAGNELGGTHPSIQLSYLAKWFHPKLFHDMNPVKIHKEWVETFLGIEYKGVYAYPTYPVT
jgi:iron complex transport system substrate-binding protein